MKIPKPLTDTRIKSTPAKEKRQVICDGGARGLYLVVSPKPTGRKAWEFRYVSPSTKKQSSVQLGAYPSMGLSDARRAAEEQRALLEKGTDPATEKRRRETANILTLEAVARVWDASRTDCDEHTRHTAMRRLEMFVFPTLGSRPLASIVQGDLTKVLDPIKAQGQADTANRVATVLSQVYRFAIARGDVEIDRAAQVKGNYPKAKGEHYAAIVDPVKFGGLLRAIDGYSGYVVRQALLFDALTFVRSAELRGAAWTEFAIDGPEPRWVIPAARMKKKDNGDHIVPLSRQAVAILEAMRPISGRGALVFPGLRPGKPLSDATLNAALTTLGYTSEVHRVHGFRSSASTMLNAMAANEGYARWNPETIEEQLAHRPTDAVRMAYHRGNQIEQRRVMMQAWADELDRMRSLGQGE